METTQGRVYPGKEQPITTSYEELLSICLRNCANSYNAFAIEGSSSMIPSVGPMSRTVSRPDPYRYVLSVRVLWAHVREADRDQNLKKMWADCPQKGLSEAPFGPYEELHHSILEKVEEKGLLMGKVRRSLVGA